MERLILYILPIQLFLAFFSYGMTLAYHQKKWPSIASESWREDVGFSLMVCFLSLVPIYGIIVTSVMFFMTGFAKHGLMYKKPNP